MLQTFTKTSDLKFLSLSYKQGVSISQQATLCLTKLLPFVRMSGYACVQNT
jgi:hypothetical protein